MIRRQRQWTVPSEWFSDAVRMRHVSSTRLDDEALRDAARRGGGRFAARAACWRLVLVTFCCARRARNAVSLASVRHAIYIADWHTHPRSPLMRCLMVMSVVVTPPSVDVAASAVVVVRADDGRARRLAAKASGRRSAAAAPAGGGGGAKRRGGAAGGGARDDDRDDDGGTAAVSVVVVAALGPTQRRCNPAVGRSGEPSDQPDATASRAEPSTHVVVRGAICLTMARTAR